MHYKYGMKTGMHTRLREMRVKAGFRSSAEAADAHGWKAPTYAGHENGSRGFNIDLVEIYAKAFNSDPVWLAFGIDANRDRVANIPDSTLSEVLILVLKHPHIKRAKPEQVSELVLEICRYVHKSGSVGMASVIDFQMAKLARSA